MTGVLLFSMTALILELGLVYWRAASCRWLPFAFFRCLPSQALPRRKREMEDHAHAHAHDTRLNEAVAVSSSTVLVQSLCEAPAGPHPMSASLSACSLV